MLQRNNDEATIRTIVEYGVAVGQKYATESILFFNGPSTSRLAVPADTHEQQSHGQVIAFRLFVQFSERDKFQL